MERKWGNRRGGRRKPDKGGRGEGGGRRGMERGRRNGKGSEEEERWRGKGGIKGEDEGDKTREAKEDGIDGEWKEMRAIRQRESGLGNGRGEEGDETR